MTAFGPYKGTETINFTELEEINLFVISGNTGAGKTTIFDGIAFALYGSASGSDREDAKTLRSDFADDNVHTSVELEFSLKGRTYRILRQLGHVKKGNKSKTGERYEFFEKIDGKEVPCVDRQIVSEIDKKVEAIIGLTQDQFKQIVMLPQGEFRKLLTSQTENKEAILRRLFKTENYKQVNERLRNKKAFIEQDFEQLKKMRDYYIGNVSSVLPKREDSILSEVFTAENYNVNQIVLGLEAEVDFYRKEINANEQDYNEAYKAHDQEQTAFHRASYLNERFKELDQKEKQLQELNQRASANAEKEKKLEIAERASTIEVYEKQAVDWQKEEKAKEKILEKVEAAKKQALANLKQAEVTFRQEDNKRELREETRKKLDRLNEHLPIVKDAANRQLHLVQLAEKGKEAQLKLEKIKSQLDDKNKTAETYKLQMDQLDQNVSLLRDKEKQLNEMRDQAKVLKVFIDLKEQQNVLSKDFSIKEKEYLQTKNAYQNMERAWLSNQAVILANHLHSGEACPVCGSVEHPNKATTKEELITKEELEAFKKVLDDKDEAYRNTTAALRANTSQLEEKQKEIAIYSIPIKDTSDVFNQLVEKGKQAAKEVKMIEKQSEQLKQLKAAYENVLTEIKQLELLRQKQDKFYQDHRATYKADKAVYEERLRDIPEEIRDLSQLEKKISDTRALNLKLEKDWEDAQALLEKAKVEQTKAVAEAVSAENQLNETKEKRLEADNKFQALLKKAGFESLDAYNRAKMSSEDRKSWKEEITQFNQSLASLNQHVTELKASLKDKTRVDLNILQEKLDKLKAAYESALHRLNQSKENYQKATELKINIINAESKVNEREGELATITDLYDVVRGQNSKKISFERYLQIEYLEQIIEAANGRLRRLSNGQYYLTRSDRQETHGRQSGLALDVYDSYTGQTRDVKSLSGGEKFNASLSLALGMSDVIQSFQGNISIDTMFIDEGFGSLDEESLTKAIDALIDLGQSGRMIGVISHVQELKNMFPAMLEVKKTKEGHSQTKFVVK